MLTEIARAIEFATSIISPLKIISVAEVLTPEDQKNICRLYLIRPSTRHINARKGFLAYTCEEGNPAF